MWIAVVTKTGNHTQMGKIAAELMKASAQTSSGSGAQKTPLQIAMMYLAYGCFILVVVLMLIVFAVSHFKITDSVLGYAISVGK
jgi:magnesium-transporting ATPase (P-type)